MCGEGSLIDRRMERVCRLNTRDLAEWCVEEDSAEEGLLAINVCGDRLMGPFTHSAVDSCLL